VRDNDYLGHEEIAKLPVIPSRTVDFQDLKDAVVRAVEGEATLEDLTNGLLYGDGVRPEYFIQVDQNARELWSKAVSLFVKLSGYHQRQKGARDGKDLSPEECWRAIFGSMEECVNPTVRLSWFDLSRRTRSKGPTSCSRAFERTGFRLTGQHSTREAAGGPCPRCGIFTVPENMDREHLACYACV